MVTVAHRAHKLAQFTLVFISILLGASPLAYAEHRAGWSEASDWRPLLPSDWGNGSARYGRGGRDEFVPPAPRGDLRGDIINNSRMRESGRGPERGGRR